MKTYLNISKENQLKGINLSDFSVARLESKVVGKDELLSWLSSTLNFPSYFGHNWDALEDMVNDFHWIKGKKGVIINHKLLPVLSLKEMEIYFCILDKAVKSWERSRERNFKLIVTIPPTKFDKAKNV